MEELDDNDKITGIIDECKEICEGCWFRSNFGVDLNKYGVGKCLKDYCDHYQIAPIAEELAKKISGEDPNSEDEWN
jgi:hypothetical protein